MTVKIIAELAGFFITNCMAHHVAEAAKKQRKRRSFLRFRMFRKPVEKPTGFWNRLSYLIY
jgi:hypothetical protein